MYRLVVIRVGKPTLWQTLHVTGRWSSPENHSQAVRNLVVEGYSVIALFLGRGDIPLAASKITSVRERLIEDEPFPHTTDIGPLRTFIEFDPLSLMNLENGFTVTHHSVLQHVRYQIGSQIAIPQHVSREFLNYFLVMTSVNQAPYRGNVTYLVPDSNLNSFNNNVNFII